jgi:Flp pilus assembly protein TadD
MQWRVFWHGCLMGVLCLTCPAQGGDPARVQSRVFDIEYAVNREALPLDAVDLWYTLDRGQSWHKYGADDDRQSPFVFHAPSEGLFGLFFVVTNATGASSQPPTASTKPHRWVFVDYTPPIAQLHPPRVTSATGQPVVQIRWTAIDTHLVSRPIELAYRQMSGDTWHPVNAAPLANTGRYDWRVPAGAAGAIALRVTVTDQGGHRVHGEPQVIDIPQTEATYSPEAKRAEAQPDRSARTVLASATNGPKERARQHYDEAIACRERGDHRRAVSFLRKAVALDPEMTEGIVELASTLYSLGDFDRAGEAYELALKQRPTMRAALRGAAMVDRQWNNYSRAARRLRTILRYNPNDAEVWMNLGDVAVFQGDDILARDCYERATTVSPEERDVIEQARQRLGLMDGMSRTYDRKAIR